MSRRSMPAEMLRVVGLEPEHNGQSKIRHTLTDQGNAERLIDQHGRDLRYCYLWGKWLVWDGKRWRPDDTGAVVRFAKEAARGIYTEAAEALTDEAAKSLGKWARQSLSEARIKAMIELAKSEPGIPVTPEELDASPWLLNCENGTIDLRTGDLHDYRRENLITKLAPVEYDPDASAPTFTAFLERILPSEDLRLFVQRASGYGATGDTSEQCLFIGHGIGANGKSTLQEILQAALGDYAMRTPSDMLLARHAGGIPNDVARLKGARFVTASETEDGRRLAESLIKELTGQDTISARFMRAEWFDFKPTHKLWLATNHKPTIKGTDNAIWRRIRLIPFTVTIPKEEQDRKLTEKLRTELPGVLAWIVRGCLEWLRDGLQPPDEVRRATGQYRAEMDVLAAFIQDECIVAKSASASAKALYRTYREWCEENGERAESQQKFGTRMSERGYERRRITSGSRKGAYEYVGIGITHDNGPNGEPFDGERFTQQNTSKSQENNAMLNTGGERSEPKFAITGENKTRDGAMPKSSSLGSPRSPDGKNDKKHKPQRRLTEEQQREIQQLISRGFSEYAARVQVLAPGHPLDCECEVCE